MSHEIATSEKDENRSDLLSYIRAVTKEVKTWPAWRRIEYINDYSDSEESPKSGDDE